jgi:protein-tyrosine phosphatase
MVKTSENDPLRIAELPLGNGFIGLTICPGKHDKDAWSGPCARSLDTDLAAVKMWGAGVVVTLMEAWELTALNVASLQKAVPAHGMSWWHLPVKDGFALEYPEDGYMEHQVDRWTLPCILLRLFLHAGGRVLIHCRGGLGRTGSLAARLLIEEGLDAEQVISAVRSVRPGAIETEEQEEYLRYLPERLLLKTPLRKAVSGLSEELFAEPVDRLFRQAEHFSLEVWEQEFRKLLLPS